jgi:argininosuccinate lyase
MKLWQNVFETEIDKLADEFNSSIGFDKILYEYDIKGSIAHVSMLVKQNIISQKDGSEIITALEELLSDIKSGKIAIDESYEDIHSFVELYLTKKIGSVAKKMHTGRSRNDQVALDMKLYVIDKSRQISSLLGELIQKLITKAEENTSAIMPMFTHLRKAQPSTYGHYLCAYIEMFLRDLNKIYTVYENCMHTMPLGSGACCGNTYDIDRNYVAEKLGFTDITYNSIDGVSDRDYILDMLYALSMIMMHMSRYCEELIIFSSEQYGFFKISDAFCSGSSMMPQKKNPDMAELIRGKTGRIYGALTQMLATMKAQPLSYNKDMQEDKECFFNAVDTTIKCIQIFTAMAEAIVLNKEAMYTAAKDSYITAVDAADYLSKKGLPFRDAYGAAAKLVNYCINKGIYFYDLTTLEMQTIHPDFDAGLLDAITVENSIALRKQPGSPAFDMVAQSLAKYKERLSKFL